MTISSKFKFIKVKSKLMELKLLLTNSYGGHIFVLIFANKNILLHTMSNSVEMMNLCAIINYNFAFKLQ